MKRYTSLLVAGLMLGSATMAYSETFFKDNFEKSGWEDRWIFSDKNQGKMGLTAGEWHGSKHPEGIQTQEDARFYDISSKFPKPYTNKDQDLIIQYSAKFEQKIDCGGGYIKVLDKSLEQKNFHGDSEYSIMFGPDFCGSATQKLHFIINYNGKNHDWKKEVKPPKDQLTHLYTAIIHPDNTYEVRIDNETKEKGSLEEDWDFLPPKEIPDPEAKKPDDWVDEEMIPDPEDKKPDDWDQPEMIPDPEAEKPDDWDEEEDGEWEKPMIPNPEYKGEWEPKMIKNPDYKGPWEPPTIPNPDYKEDKELYLRPDLQHIGIDVWQVKSGTIFDNFFVSDSVKEAEEEAEVVLENKKEEEEIFNKKEEEERKKREEEMKKKEEEEKEKEEKEEEVSADEEEDEENTHDEL